ncbi:MAG TPA: peptidyl-prolyl cis-trans isomerase [Pyrinomonadaceae bacterium]|nr:peptidyl-prolyl cis-trans isomerase [Pyrinomonadaceae bacterium]
MRVLACSAILFASVLFTVTDIRAQESEERVIDEVVAQVNDGVITLSRIKREMKSIVDAEVQQGKKKEDVEKTVNEKQGELIANLINEELLIQKAKEAGLDSEIEASLNQRFIEIMKQNNVKTLEALYEQMRQQNVDPAEIREMWKKQATRDRVLQREVQSKVYWDATPGQVKEYFEKNKVRFTKPENVSISELFLAFAGRDEAAVREKAKSLVTQIRGGGDFDKLAKENGDPGVVTQGAGKVEKLKVADLVDTIKVPLKDVKVGGITDPIEAKDLGIIILRVDAREQASSESFFDDGAVRSAILQEKYPEAQKKFFATLRQDAYIKINDTYRPIVAPLLFADERKEKVVSSKQD